MALQYENFGLRRIVVEANLWPPVEEISNATLSELFGRLNTGDIFESCQLLVDAATFEGELWNYEINGGTVRIRCFGYSTPEVLYARIKALLDGTRAIALDGRVAFYSEEIRVFADVPEGGNRNVGDVVQKRLLRRPADREGLPGLGWAGLALGGTTEQFGWRANIDPKDDGLLSLFAGLRFAPEQEPPRPGPDLDLIEHQVRLACSFVEDDLRNFSARIFK